MPMEASRSQVRQHMGSVAWKAALLFRSRAFSTGDQVCAAVAREKGKLWESTLKCYLAVIAYPSRKCSLFAYSIWAVQLLPPSLPPSLSSLLYVFHLSLKMGWKWFQCYSKIDWVLMKTSIVWLRVIQSPYLEGKANVMKPLQYSDPWCSGRHEHPVTSCSWETFEEELLLFRK